jgi:hypothetical protein
VSSFEFAGNVVGLIVKSDLNKQSIAKIHDQIREKLKEYDRINLFIEIEKEAKVELTALFEDIKYKYKHAEQFNKIGVVTDVSWFSNLIDIKDLVMKADIRTFDHENRLEALSWIAE